MSNALKNLFEVADRLLVVGAPRARQVIDGAEMSGPLRPGQLRLGGNTRIVLQRLADHVNFSSNTAEARSGAWVSRTALAAGTMSLKTVDRALMELKRLGLIRADARFCGPGKSAASQLSNLCTFNSAVLDACKFEDKFKSVVVMPSNGFAWPKAREHGLKKAKRVEGFPFEYRCKPRQDSVSGPPLVKMTHELLMDTTPKESGAQGPGSGSRERKKKRAKPTPGTGLNVSTFRPGTGKVSTLSVRPPSPVPRSRAQP